MHPSATALEAALQDDQESATLDFKESIDVASNGEWLELIKDVVAMANSGGGVIIIGLLDDGSPSGFDVAPILAVDSADVTNKIFAYTGQHFGNFRISGVPGGMTKICEWSGASTTLRIPPSQDCFTASISLRKKSLRSSEVQGSLFAPWRKYTEPSENAVFGFPFCP